MSCNDKIIYLTKNEKERLFRCINASGTKFLIRDRAIIKLAYYCALRITEIRNMKLSDFNKETREIRCDRLQNGKNNVLKIIDNDIYRDICEYYDLRKEDEYLSDYFFISQQDKPMSKVILGKIFGDYCELANIEKDKQRFQVLRYTRVIDLIDLGFSLKQIMWWTGLTQITNSKIYELYLFKKYSANPLSKEVESFDTFDDAYNILERGKNASEEKNSE